MARFIIAAALAVALSAARRSPRSGRQAAHPLAAGMTSPLGIGAHRQSPRPKSPLSPPKSFRQARRLRGYPATTNLNEEQDKTSPIARRIAAADDEAQDRERDHAESDDRRHELPQRPRAGRPDVDVAAGEDRGQSFEVFRVALLEERDTESGDQPLDDRRPEQVRDQHRRDAAPRPYGLYRGTPLASVKRSGWMPSSMPTMSAAAVIPA